MKNLVLLFVAIILTQSCNFQKIDDGFYHIVSLSNQQSIAIPRASNKNGEQLKVRYKTGNKFNQLWTFEPVKDYYIIRSKYNNKVLTSNNNIAEQQEYVNSENQHWKIEKMKDTISIISMETGLALTLAPSPLILANMNKEVRTNLLNVALNKYQLKIENWNKLSLDQLSSNFLVMAQILTTDAPSISQKNETQKDMELLLQICKTNNLEFVSTLTNYAYDYLNK